MDALKYNSEPPILPASFSMYTVNRSALVMHSAEQMYQLVNDVGAYGDFLPWCSGSEVISESEQEMVATVTIAFKGLSKSFTTRNQLIRNQETRMQLVDGPFSELSGVWTYTELSDSASKIELNLEFGFSNKILAAAIGPVFHSIADSMVDSFSRRADELYGTGSI